MREGTVQTNGATVKRLRMEHGWSQEELAVKIGCSKRTIEKVEAGGPAYLRTLAEIAEALGPSVQVKDLMLGHDHEAPTTAAPPVHAKIGNAPPLPSLLIGREADLSKLASRLSRAVLVGEATPTQVLTAVRGWPGVGKTAIARAIAHLPELAAAFPDGVLWAALGPTPSILANLVAWGRALGDKDLLLAKDVAEASHRLGGLLRDRRMLLIVDDVWEPDHVVPFLIGGRLCATLVTTRLSSLADALSSQPDGVLLVRRTVELLSFVFCGGVLAASEPFPGLAQPPRQIPALGSV